MIIKSLNKEYSYKRNEPNTKNVFSNTLEIYGKPRIKSTPLITKTIGGHCFEVKFS
jgi:hypothetical protein